MSSISLFQKITQTKNGEQIPIDIFLDYIRDGKWQDIVLPIRAMDKKDRDTAKKNVPYVTISGTFEDRKDNGAAFHSGFIGIDIDNVDAEETKSLLCVDKHVYAAFTSISGRGLCVLIKINGDKHREAFAGISEYLYENYSVIIDPTSVNPSRARFISYDPHLYINDKAAKFTIYPKIKAPKKIEQIVFTQSDFDTILQEIQRRNLNLCDNYSEWLRIGFAIAEKFGEGGRNYFHMLSQFSSKYKPADTDKQYNNCLKARGSRISTISTFYYYCKQAGLQTYSQTTKTVISAAVNAKKGGLSKDTIVKNLKQFEEITPEVSTEIVDQVFENNIEYSEDSLIVQVEQWLKFNYEIRKNEVTRNFEENGVPLTQYDLNSMFLTAKKVMDKINYELFDRIINSKNTPLYNPFLEFISANQHLKPIGKIDKLFDTILSQDFEYNRKFGKKWLVGLIASIHGQHSPLMLILSGRLQGTGKTEFFRRLLPYELSAYYADISAGIKDTDLNILMTQKLLLLDDECGGKSKKDEIALKSILSKQTFSLREPYGRNNVDLRRLAVLCGTTNEENILNDTTGNRRIIPIPVFSINHKDYNEIDKTEVFMEAYQLWRSGFNWQLTREDIDNLATQTVQFESHSLEYELIIKWYAKPSPGHFTDYMTASDIKVEIEGKTGQKLLLDRIGKEMQRIGFKQVSKRIDGNPKKVYEVVRAGS